LTIIRAFDKLCRFLKLNEQVEQMKGYQRRYLKGLAHKIKPTVFIGQKGLQPSVVDAIDASLDQHELIKIKFVDFKEKNLKDEVTLAIEKKTGSALVGMIGHIAIYYRAQKDPEKRKIHLPVK
jgi:RNA-binding protein